MPITSSLGDTPIEEPQQDWGSLVKSKATDAGLDPNVMHSLMMNESRGDPNASAYPRSSAKGLFQFTEGTAGDLGIDPSDPNQSIEGAMRHYKRLRDKYGGDDKKALQAWHDGEGNVDAGLQPPKNADPGFADRVLNWKAPKGSGQRGLIKTNNSILQDVKSSLGDSPIMSSLGDTPIPEKSGWAEAATSSALSVGNFFSTMIGGGVGGLVGAARKLYGYATGDKLSTSQSKDLIEDFERNSDLKRIAKDTFGVDEKWLNSKASDWMDKVLEAPAKYVGNPAYRGLVGFTHWAMHGFSDDALNQATGWMSDPYKHPEVSNPYTADLGGAVLGYGLAGGLTGKATTELNPSEGMRVYDPKTQKWTKQDLPEGSRGRGSEGMMSDEVLSSLGDKPVDMGPDVTEQGFAAQGKELNPQQDMFEQPQGQYDQAAGARMQEDMNKLQQQGELPLGEPTISVPSTKAVADAEKGTAQVLPDEVGGQQEPTPGRPGPLGGRQEPRMAGPGEKVDVPEEQWNVGTEAPGGRNEPFMKEAPHPLDEDKPQQELPITEPERTEPSIYESQHGKDVREQERIQEARMRAKEEAGLTEKRSKNEEPIVPEKEDFTGNKYRPMMPGAKERFGGDRAPFEQGETNTVPFKEGDVNMDLLPEQAAKDPVISRNLEKAKQSDADLKTMKERAAGEELTPQTKRALDKEIEKEEKKNEKLKDQIRARLENKYDINFTNLISRTREAEGGKPYSIYDHLPERKMSDVEHTKTYLEAMKENRPERTDIEKTQAWINSPARGGVGRKEGGAINFFGGREEAPTTVIDKGKDIASRWANTRMSGAEVLEEAKRADGGQLKDISDAQELGYSSVTPGARATQLLLEGRGNKGAARVVKWIGDKIREADLKKETTDRDFLQGSVIGKALLRPWDARRAKNYMFETRDKNSTSKQDVVTYNDIANRAMRNGREATREDFQNDTQWKMYQEERGSYNKLLDKVDAARKLVGLDPIRRIPGWRPMMIEGDYRIPIKDKQGNVKYIVAADVKGQLQRVTAIAGTLGSWRPKALSTALNDLMKTLPKDVRDQLVVGDTKSVGKSPGKFGAKDLSAFEEMLDLLSKDDPLTKAVHQAYTDLLTKRGFGTHTLHRKGGWEGFMGSEGGWEGAKQMRKAQEKYVQQATSYIANIEKRAAQAELFKAAGTKWQSYTEEGTGITRKSPEVLMPPNLTDYIRGYVEHSVGGTKGMLGYEEYLAQRWFDVAGFGHSSFPKAISNIGNFFVASWLLKPSYWLAQPFQMMNVAAKLSHETGMVHTTAHMIHGIKQWLFPDAGAKEYMNWAVRHGDLDSQVAKALDSPFAYKNANLHNFFAKIKDVGIGKVDEVFARIPAALAAESALRKFIPDKQARWEAASNIAKNGLTDYSRSEQAQVFEKMGFVGRAFKPLKAFQLNFYGQFMDYVHRLKARDPGAAQGMATFLANNVFQAGLYGFLGVKEASIIISGLNYMFNQAYPNPEELLLQSGISDAFMFGGTSTITGLPFKDNYSMSGSLGAPALPSMVQAPVMEGLYNLGKAAKVGTDILRGESNPGDKFDVARNLAPQMFTGLVEKAFSNNGGVPKKSEYDIAKGYNRSEENWNVRETLGLRSTDEVKHAGSMAQLNKRNERYKDIHARLLSTVVDDIYNGKEVSPDNIKKLLDNEYNPEGLEQAITDKLKKRLIEDYKLLLIKEPGYNSAMVDKRLLEFQQIVKELNSDEVLDAAKEMRGSR